MSIQEKSDHPAVLGKAAVAVARATGLKVFEARQLLEARSAIPAALEEAIAQQLVQALNAAGLRATALPGPAPAAAHCAAHPALDSEDRCEECRAPICGVCLLSHHAALCGDCHARRSRARHYRNIRVGVLLLVLLAVGGWAVLRSRRLDARTHWVRTVSVSVVLVSKEPVSPEALERWTQGVASLQDWFTREWNRYRPVSQLPMIAVALEGAVQVDALPVAPGSAATLPSRAQESLAFSTQLQAIDQRLGLQRPRDATIYVVLRPRAAGGSIVEGVAEAGGRLGLVQGALGEIDLALELTAVGHELLHCLGATDKYDPQGHAIAPAGLPNPQALPLYPQAAAEVMVGEVATGPEAGRPLKSLGEVQVGPATAAEIRW